jgi:REP element-mobilizing transposase RayT
MNNHIHLILQPTTKEGLQKVLKPLHMRYSQYINKQQNIIAKENIITTITSLSNVMGSIRKYDSSLSWREFILTEIKIKGQRPLCFCRWWRIFNSRQSTP